MRSPAPAAIFVLCCVAFSLPRTTHWLCAFGQPSPAPQFDAPEIQRSPAASNPQTYRSGGFLRGSRYDLRKATMLDLIRLAYGYEPDMVLGGPDWLQLDRFDIAAKAPPYTSPQDLARMLEALLTDRFKLAFHKEVRPMPAFVPAPGRRQAKNETGREL